MNNLTNTLPRPYTTISDKITPVPSLPQINTNTNVNDCYQRKWHITSICNVLPPIRTRPKTTTKPAACNSYGSVGNNDNYPQTSAAMLHPSKGQVLTAASKKIRVFWDIAPCSLVGVHRRFWGYYKALYPGGL
jgi:hypothetical protein